jgi:hypothetical protein
MGEESSNVTITPADMYNEIVGMRGDVQRLTIKLDNILDVTKDHETRLRAVEAAQGNFVTEDDLREKSNRAAAWSAAVSGVVATVVAVLAFVLYHQ